MTDPYKVPLPAPTIMDEPDEDYQSELAASLEHELERQDMLAQVREQVS